MNGESDALIRPYKPADRASVRTLSYETGEAGRPSAFPDRELFADLITRYYTDAEPESLWIVEQGGLVVGYLTGCLNTDRYKRWMRAKGHWLTALRVLFFNFDRPDVWAWARARIKTLREGGAHRRLWIEEYPAHLHLNLTEAARGHGIGGRLMNCFLEQARRAGVRGVHLATRGNNLAAQRFFQRQGFLPIAEVSAYKAVPGGFEAVPVQIMGRKLEIIS